MISHLHPIETGSLALALLIALALFLLPVPAGAEPASIQPIRVPAWLYLPDVRNPQDWFTQPEFEAALAAAGFDPAVWTQHTACTLDDSADAPRVIRYATCDLFLTEDGNPSPGGANFITFWYSTELGRVAWLPDNGAVVAATVEGL